MNQKNHAQNTDDRKYIIIADPDAWISERLFRKPTNEEALFFEEWEKGEWRESKIFADNYTFLRCVTETELTNLIAQNFSRMNSLEQRYWSSIF